MIPVVLKTAWFLGLAITGYLLTVPAFNPGLGKVNIITSILVVIALAGLTLVANLFGWHLNGHGYNSTVQSAGRLARQLLKLFFIPAGIVAVSGNAIGLLLSGNKIYILNIGLAAIFLFFVIICKVIFIKVFRIPGIDYL